MATAPTSFLRLRNDLGGGLAGTVWALVPDQSSGPDEDPDILVDSPPVVDTELLLTQYTASLGGKYTSESNTEPLSQALDGVDRHIYSDIHLGAAPADEVRGTWLYAKIPTTGDSTTDAMHVWETDLVQGAVAEYISEGKASNLASFVTGASVELVDADGSSHEVDSGAGDIAAGQQFPAQKSGISDIALRNQIVDRLRSAGLAADSIRVLHPLGPALAVTVKVNSLDEVRGRFAQLAVELFGSDPEVEGYFLEVQWADGTPLVRQSTSFRSGAGRLWIADGYQDLVGAIHG